MRSFASLLPARPSSLLALSAQFLDRAGADADAIREGVTIVECPDILVTDVCDAIDELVFAEQATRGWSFEDDGKAIILDGGASDGKFMRALAIGKTLIVVSPAARLPTDADVHQDRRYTIDGDLCDSIVKNVIEAVTGGDVSNTVARGLSRGLEASTLTATVRPTITASDAIERLRKLAEKADAKAEKFDRDMSELAKLAAGDDAVPLANATAKVVTKLSDVTGFGDARAWGLQLAADLRAYASGAIAWEDVDKGILLVGEPGVGKTFFARLLAAECGVPLIQASYADFETAASSWQISKAIKKIFADARKKAPCIVFIDEIDSFGVRGGNAHNDSFWGAIINAILAELDGAEPRDGVVVIGATNHPDRVDSALKRAGRLEREIAIPNPSSPAEIGGIIRHHLGAPCEDGLLSEASLACRGLSPATLAMLCREARRAARRTGRAPTPMDVVDAARAARPQRDAADDAMTCLHEATHAVASVVLGLRLHAVEVDGQPRTEVRFSSIHATREVTENFVIMMLSARRADSMMGGGATAGAVSDLAFATDMVRNAIARWGLTGSVYAYGEAEATLDRDVKIDVKDYLETLDIRAAKLVDAHRDAILRVAEALRVRRYLDADEVREIVKGTGPTLS